MLSKALQRRECYLGGTPPPPHIWQPRHSLVDNLAIIGEPHRRPRTDSEENRARRAGDRLHLRNPDQEQHSRAQGTEHLSDQGAYYVERIVNELAGVRLAPA